MNESLPDILLVENHPDTLKYTSKYLRRRGYEVREASGMVSALRQYNEQPAAIVISDIGLSDGDGWELLAQLHAQGHSPFAISMSGFGLEDREPRSLAAGFHRHLVKPFQMAELVSLLQEAPLVRKK